MTDKNTTVISIEARYRTTSRRTPRSERVLGWCAECAAKTEKLTPQEAAEVFRTSTPTVYRLIEDDAFHGAENEAGALLVCGNSIQRCLDSRL